MQSSSESLPECISSLNGSNNGAIRFKSHHNDVAFLLQCDGHVCSGMKKSDYFGMVVKVVAELSEISEEVILGKSREYEVVDARWVVICLMKEKGYTTKQISSLIKRPIRTVNHAVNSFKIRAKSSSSCLGNTLEMARQQLGNNT